MVLVTMSACQNPSLGTKLEVMRSLRFLTRDKNLNFCQIFKLNIALSLLIDDIEGILNLLDKQKIVSEEVEIIEKELAETSGLIWPRVSIIGTRIKYLEKPTKPKYC